MSDQPLQGSDCESVVREVLIAATDIIAPGDEPYVGWSAVLAERIVKELEGRGSSANRWNAFNTDELEVLANGLELDVTLRCECEECTLSDAFIREIRTAYFNRLVAEHVVEKETP